MGSKIRGPQPNPQRPPRKSKEKADAFQHRPQWRHTKRMEGHVKHPPRVWTDMQFTVHLENKPGQIAKLGRVLKRANVNIVAMTVVEQADMGTVRFVVDAKADARKALDKARLDYSVRDVVVVAANNQPGALADIGGKLGKNKINVEYAYASTHPDALQALIVLAVDHTHSAVRVLS